MADIPTKQRLDDLLTYDAETGVLTWRERKWIDNRGRNKAFRFGGKVAGHPRSDGKVVVGVDGRLHLAHRLIWMMVHGEKPDCVDHINGDCGDNRLCNLRNGTQADNNRNVARRSDNASGQAGVNYDATRRTWRVTLQGRAIGSFKSKSDAIACRLRAQRAAGFTDRHGQ